MEDNATSLESLIEKTKEVGKSGFELLKMKALDKFADISSSFLSWIIAIIVIALSFVFANFGLAIWLGDLTGKLYYGFFIVAGFYALIGILFCLFGRPALKHKISDVLIKKALK